MAALAALFCGMAAWSWRKWADPIVDFGREPYLAWQILAGRELYHDLASLFGPLSPYVNALWFRLFGASLTTLAECNLAIAALLTLVVYRSLVIPCGRLAAMLATATLLIGFVFPHHLEDAANYNFVWPYTHSATHGAVLLVCGIAVLGRALRTRSTAAWAAAGLCTGGALLTKPEIALAAAASAGVAIAWHLGERRDARDGHALAAFAIGTASLPAAFAATLGLDALLLPWVSVVRIVDERSVFYAHLAGTDDVAGNGLRLVLDALLWIAALLALVAADLAYRTLPSWHPRVRALAVAGIGMLVARDMPGVGRALPLLLPIAGGYLAWVAWRRRRRGADGTALVPLVLWCAAAWVLLWKMPLNVRFHHYGFYLAMPAAVLCVAVGVGLLPRLMAGRHPGAGWLVQPTLACAVVVLLVHSLGRSALSYALMDTPVGTGADLHFARDEGPLPTATIAATIQERIDALVPPEATLAVLPEGAMLNFLTRHPNPTPYHQLTPPEVKVYDGPTVVHAFAARPPDFVLLLAWSGREYGFRDFDEPGWGAELVDWVRRHYEPMGPVRTAGSAVATLWRRREWLAGAAITPAACNQGGCTE